MSIRLIGIDCATEAAKTGLAFGTFADDKLQVHEAKVCAKKECVTEAVADWLGKGAGLALIALDAPLGWPIDMGRVLLGHRAGEPIAVEADILFRRATDRLVKATIGKTPLDVGADRIARTARWALNFLADLGERLKAPVPLAWAPTLNASVSAIEVYPAATLICHGIETAEYKRADQVAGRTRILECFQEIAMLPKDRATMEASADALDAALCLLAACDFLRGEALKPKEPMEWEFAQKEGWIWFRERRSSSPCDDLE